MSKFVLLLESNKNVKSTAIRQFRYEYSLATVRDRFMNAFTCWWKNIKLQNKAIKVSEKQEKKIYTDG